MQDETDVTPTRVRIRRKGYSFELSGGGPYALRDGVVYEKDKPAVIVGNDKRTTRNLDTKNISQVFLRGEFTVELSADSSGQGSISGDAAFLRILQIKRVGNQLHIETPPNLVGRPQLPTTVRLAVRKLEHLAVSRATTVQARVATDKLSIVASDYARLRLAGAADSVSVKAQKATTVLAGDLACSQAQVDAGGYSRVRVAPQATLLAHATKASQVLYATNPKVQASADAYSKIKRTR